MATTYLSFAQLHRRARAAAGKALGANYGASDRADCAADVLGDLFTSITAASLDAMPEPVKREHGAAADVLRYIGNVQREPRRAMRAARISEPSFTADDARASFTALYRRAQDWRDAREAAADRDAWERPETVAPTPQISTATALRRLAEHDLSVAMRACSRIAAELGSPAADSLLLAATADLTADEAAALYGRSHAAERKRVSRATADLRSVLTADKLLDVLADGMPAEASRDYFTTWTRRSGKRAAAPKTSHVLKGELMLSREDCSRAALARAAEPRVWSITPADRIGTDGGTWAEKPADIEAARETCHVHYIEPDPDGAAQRREAAERAYRAETGAREDDEAYAYRRMAVSSAITASTGRPTATDVGRTAGKPAEKYASRTVRLGRD